MFLRASDNDRAEVGMLGCYYRRIMMTSSLRDTAHYYFISTAHVSAEHALWLVQGSFYRYLYATLLETPPFSTYN